MICERCGKTFFVTPSKQANGRGRFCSRECHFPPAMFTCETCGKVFRRPPSTNARFCCKACADVAPERSEQAREHAIEQWQSAESRAKLMDGIERRSQDPAWQNAPHFQRGEKHPRYKADKLPRLTEVGRYRYMKWRRDVLSRDNFTCQHCGKRGGRLTAHHVQPWADFPELRYEVDNGQTLCIECHSDIHGWTGVPVTQTCLHCQRVYKPTRSHQKYCSKECFYKSRRK